MKHYAPKPPKLPEGKPAHRCDSCGGYTNRVDECGPCIVKKNADKMFSPGLAR